MMKQLIIRMLSRRTSRAVKLRLVAMSATIGLMAESALAAGGKPATKIYNVADTRSMDGGFSKWIADIYNTNLWLYALTVVVVMALMGLILGYGMDRVLGVLGINLGKLEHHE
jgi:ABC-type phosphate/phosphonate transport system permease subunit